jgi:hypothetical protein
MPTKTNKFKITYGGWYQRTTLHLSEIHYFFMDGNSSLNLDKAKLKDFHKKLDLLSVSREPGNFEFVKCITASGIEIRYYEDGLYILELESEDINSSKQLLADYYQNKLGPAIAYIFSLGAPTPKVLANIKTVHPIVISFQHKQPKNFTPDEEIFGKVYTKITSDNITVFKTGQYIFISSTADSHKSFREIIEMQIFFREFKDQLEKYLAIHRSIWETISEIKEAKMIKGRDVDAIRGRLDGYQKTISLISNRINQMSSYISTRSSLAKNLDIDKDLVLLFEYKFETLTDTLSYIKEIWKMTADYLSSAIGNLVEIKNQSTSNNLKSLQTITSIGVISGVLGYLSANKLPSVSQSGVVYFIILFCLTWSMNHYMALKYKNKKYSLRFGDREANL